MSINLKDNARSKNKTNSSEDELSNNLSSDFFQNISFTLAGTNSRKRHSTLPKFSWKNKTYQYFLFLLCTLKTSLELQKCANFSLFFPSFFGSFFLFSSENFTHFLLKESTRSLVTSRRLRKYPRKETTQERKQKSQHIFL